MENEKSFKDKKQKPVKDKKGNVSYFLNRMSTPYYIFYHISSKIGDFFLKMPVFMSTVFTRAGGIGSS